MIKLYAKAQATLATLKRDERGVTAIEYALIGVAMATIVAAVFTGDSGLQGALEGAIAKIKAKL